MPTPLKELWAEARRVLGMIDWLRAALILVILMGLAVIVWVIRWFL